MPALNIEGVNDLVLAVLPKVASKLGQWKDISLDLQKYYFADRLFRNKAQRLEMGGDRAIWDLQVANPGNFKFTGLYAVDISNDINMLTQAAENWAMSTTNYIYDLKLDAFQQGVTAIVKLLTVKEHALQNDFFAGMETAVWTAPPSSTQNPRRISGFPFWIQKSATEGFNGGDPAGFSAGAANILTATYPGWANRTFAYSQITRDDLCEKVIRCIDLCEFDPPVAYQELKGGKPDFEIFTVYSVLSEIRKKLQAGNDNIGMDWGAFSGKAVVRGVPVRHVPALGKTTSPAYDSQNPIYGINWRTFEYANKSGFAMQKLSPFQVANQHTVRMRCMDDTGQLMCYDRRANWVGYYSATAAAPVNNPE